SRLCQNHKYRFHADRTKGNMRSGKADGHQQVIYLCFFRDDGAIGNRKRWETSYFYITLILNHTIDYQSVTIVRIHRISGITNIIRNDFSALTMMLRHDHITDHSPGFADIQLWRPMLIF